MISAQIFSCILPVFSIIGAYFYDILSMHISLSEKQIYQLYKECTSGSGKAFPKFIFAETNTKVSKLTDHIYLYFELSISVHPKQLFFNFLYRRIHQKRKSAQVDDPEYS